MPVTAKLSKQFYDRLGEAVTNELVDWFNQVDAAYKFDLREMNEMNFARFDAKLEHVLRSPTRRRSVDLPRFAMTCGTPSFRSRGHFAIRPGSSSWLGRCCWRRTSRSGFDSPAIIPLDRGSPGR